MSKKTLRISPCGTRMSSDVVDGLTPEQRERASEHVREVCGLAREGEPHFSFSWNWEYGKSMPSGTYHDLLTAGFNQDHVCSHERGNFQSWSTGPMKSPQICTYCGESYGKLAVQDILDFRVTPETKASWEDPATIPALKHYVGYKSLVRPGGNWKTDAP